MDPFYSAVRELPQRMSMNKNESVRLLLSIRRPGGARTEGPLGAALRPLSGLKPNEQRTIEDRTFAALRSFEQSLHYLAGVLTVIPFLKNQTPMLKFDAEELLLEGHRMGVRPEFSAAFIRRLRIHEERILKLVKKIENAA
jgi:hypothetical protein